jgi:hypothetical protein
MSHPSTPLWALPKQWLLIVPKQEFTATVFAPDVSLWSHS